MGSRYGGDPRISDGALPYRDAPPRWDRDTFAREQEERYRGPAVAERERAYEGYRSPPRRGAEVIERKYVEEERYGPRGTRVEKRYFEEDDYYIDPRAARGAMIPFRERPEPPPPRPGILRRQSSLDTFDRKPTRRYEELEERRAPAALPPPDRYARPRYEERIYYDDVKVQEPEEGYREVREREWITQRRRDSSHSRERARSIADKSAREEYTEEVIEEKPFPRRGKTRMPRRIVRTEVLYDLGYPYHNEGEMIIIEKALSKELIDEVIERSRGFREVEEVKTIHTIQTPEIIETKIEEVITLPMEEAPRSVREWDNLSVRSDAKSRHSRRSHRSHSTHSRHTRKNSHSRRSESRSSSSSRSGAEIEKKTTIIERRPSRGGEEVIERRRTIYEEDLIDESNSVHVGPLALVVDRRKSRSDRDIKEEIRRLERERKNLREERRDRDVIKVERLRERSPSRNRAIIIEERGEEVIEVRKDRKGPPPPSPGIIKAMMATLT